MLAGSRLALALPPLLLVACNQGDESTPKGIPYPPPKVVTEGKIVAQIGDVPITTEELERRIRDESPFTRVQLAEDAQKKQFVDRVLRFELLAQEGWRRKLHEDPKILEQFKQVVVKSMMEAELKKIEDQLEVTDADLIAAYKERFDEFNKPATVRVAQIVRYVDSDAERKKARGFLADIEQKVLAAERKNDPRAFSRFAKEHSQDDTSKAGGGDLNFLTREELAARYGEGVAKFMFDDVAVGDMGIADAENAVVLFKKTGRRRGVERSYEQVRSQLRGQALAKKRGQLFEDWVQALMKERGVTVDYSLLDEIEVDTGGAQTGRPNAPGQ